MKLNFNKIEKNKINDLLEAKEINISLADMYLALFSDPKAIGEEEINIEMVEEGCSNKDAYLSLLLDYWQIDIENEENKKIFTSLIYPCINEIDYQKYLNNPFYKAIKASEIKQGSYQLVYDHYEPYELFPLDDIKVDINNNFIEHSSLAYSKSSFPFLALKENEVTWMCITPNEINTMQNSINKVKGDVLVMGLGLGYYPYMISNKEEVKTITIIEKDEKIINLFQKSIFPLFNHQNKIKIIKGDAIKYLKENKNHYDYCFVDLWHNAEDGLKTYLTFKENEKGHNIDEYHYWLETSLKCLYIRLFLIVLEEQLHGSNDNDYKKSNNEIDQIINDIYFKTKNLTFSSKDEIIKYLIKTMNF